MNRTWRSIFSVLLAIALLLPMAPMARAEGEEGGEGGEGANTSASTLVPATSVSLSSNRDGNRIYYRAESSYHAANAGTITITATIEPANYNGKIQWEIESNAPLKEISRTEVSSGKASITLEAQQPISIVEDVPIITAYVDTTASTSKISNYIKVWVARDTVETGSLTFAKSEATLQAGKTLQLGLNKTPVFPSGVGTPKVVYASNNASVASVDADGKLTAKSEGRAEISATVDGTKLTSKMIVSVEAPSTGLTGEATVGTTFPLQDIYDALSSQFTSAYGTTPAYVRFSGLNKASGTLRTKGGVAIVGNDPYYFKDLREMYLDPTGEGKFECSVEATDGNVNFSSGNKLVGKISITVSVPTRTIRIPLDGSENYTFNLPSADPSGKSGATLIRDAIGTFGSIEFGSVSSTSAAAGTLYVSTPANSTNRVSTGMVVLASAVDEMYFTPSRSGTYTVPFTAYYGKDATGSIACTGELIIPVDGSSLDIKVTLSAVEPYTFSEAPSSGSASLYNLLLTAINGSVGGSNWSGIKFDGAASASAVGTLHQTKAHSRAISASDYIAKSAMSQLYYVPERSGNYEITYGVYGEETSTSPIATGKLTISCSTIPTGLADITYTTSVKTSVTLLEDDFLNFYQTENGNRYQLSYVVFNEYDGEGEFYHDKTAFVPYNSADFYSATYTGSTPSNARYLNRVSFTAPSTSGFTSVLFTCYGGTSANGTTRVTSGKLTIFYTSNDVPAVSYNVYGAATTDLRDVDFTTTYNTATKTTSNKPAFNIQLLSAPTKGTLYYYYGSGSSRRTLTQANITSYTFTVNGANDTSVNNLSYSPYASSTGTDTITYVASTSNGTMLYVGTLQFKLSSDLTINVTNDGSEFQLSDFYNASESDPITYVTFQKPSAGKIYYYDGERYVTAVSETRFYTTSPSNGQYPITSAFYAPRANETGTVSLKCTVHRKSGASGTIAISVNILSKTSSGSFNDVSGVTGWASNSIDFASKIGLVKGTSTNPPRFSPSDTMRRCDLVLMLYRLAGSPAVSGSTTFTDVTSDKYYYDSAVWAYRNNIMRNVTVNNLYNPNGALTRQDFAQILFNYATAMGESTSNTGSIRSYADASSVSSNTLEGVTWAVAKGYITSAVSGQLYIEPQRAATRAEISTLLHRYLTY